MDGRRGELATSLILLAVTWWATLPEHRQREMIMRVSRALQTAAQKTAQRAGRSAMAGELEHGEPGIGYDVAYRLMTGLYRRAGQWYHTYGGANT